MIMPKVKWAMPQELPQESVDALIERVMRDHPGHSNSEIARYYEAVHQELAPLARDLEAENRHLRERLLSCPPDVAVKQLAIVLAWLTECQLASLEGLESVKRTPKSELNRQREICTRAVSQCKDLGWPPVGLRGQECVRLAERIKN